MKRTKFTTDQSVFLKNLGFRATFPDEKDPSFCIYTLKIDTHPLLKGLFLDVDGSMIDVFCQESNRGVVPGQPVLVASRNFTEAKMLALLQYLTADHVLS